MSRPELDRGVMVLGSVAWAVTLVPRPKDHAASAADTAVSYGETYERHTRWVGAPTLCCMIDAALGDDVAPNPCSDRQGPPVEASDCRELTTIMGSFPQKSSARPTADRVMRVRASYFATPTPTAEGSERMLKYLQSVSRRAAKARIVVVYERDRELRPVIAALRRAGPGFANPAPALVVSFADDIAKEPLTEAIALAHGDHPDRGRTVVLVTAETLRHGGLNIVEHGSLERTVRDVVQYTKDGPLADVLDLCNHLVIVFEETGAIYIRRDQEGALQGSIHYCPNFDRVAHRDRANYGTAPGRREIALTAIVSQIHAQMDTAPAGPWDLAGSVRLALAAYNRYFKAGFPAEGSPFPAIEQALDGTQRDHLKSLMEGEGKKAKSKKSKPDPEFLLSSLEFELQDGALETWSRVNGVLPAAAPDAKLRDLLRDIVKQGPERPFRDTEPSPAGDPWFPGPTIKCPYFGIGRIKTADPDEIEGYANLAELIRKYLGDRAWSTPLSIGVFGPPGTGKSFGVKELLTTVNPSWKETLTFNLAQFDSVELLTEAFHQVQDRALSSSDEVPLVIFDEFDSTFGTPLGWLKYFLAPMQDGVFRGQSGAYRVGRAIFVFAGGTADNFEDFKAGRGFAKPSETRTPDAASAKPPEPPKLSEAELRAAKVTDFISRLKGRLNILDINPPRAREGEKPPEEERHKKVLRLVRRAMILRSLLEQFAKPVIQPGPDLDWARIHDNVIDGFMNVDRYEHGVRSMESVIRMSRLIDGHFLPASLPARDQLEMHAPGFLDRMVEPKERPPAPPAG